MKSKNTDHRLADTLGRDLVGRLSAGRTSDSPGGADLPGFTVGFDL